MQEIKLTVEIPGLSEMANALHALATAVIVMANESKSGALRGPKPTQTVEAVPFAQATKEAPATTAAKETAPAAEPVVNETAPAEPAVAAEPAAPAVTLDMLGRAGARLIDEGHMKPLLDLLARYGVQAITQLKTEQYAAFAADMTALGAVI